MKRGQLSFLTSTHLVDDLYQGAIPALLPFLMSQRHYSYAAVSGLAFAANGLSSVVQPIFGILADRSTRTWLVPTGFCVAAAGVSTVGLVHSYALTWVLFALTGIGIAAYHPPATSHARAAGGSSQKAMSVFAVGGTIGGAIAPPLVTVVVGSAGLSGSWLLAAPAAVWALLWAIKGPWMRWRGYEPVQPLTSVKHKQGAALHDDWRSFARLGAVILGWSIPFVAINSMVALHAQRDLHQAEAVGAAVLTLYVAAQAIGMLGGGWMGDRYGRMATIRWGYVLSLPALAGIAWSPSLPVLAVCAAWFGAAMFLPFAAQVTLAQDYLPNRPGTASGLALGVAIAAGGLCSPLLGWLADAHGLRAAFWVLVAVFVAPALLAFTLPERRLEAPEPHEAAAVAESAAS
ncbi:MFS transporter [Streptomyces hygroscopicus]|uniref:MFS transporter n=1 Tax=Streptomyces hygroscopicus TaxID=1912 RepID=UPI00223F3046|nr:MFS transporter [Streptomyces hygroscopicus]MCW7944405.1 MFS transporter [Streptomyces hygroscopicus]